MVIRNSADDASQPRRRVWSSPSEVDPGTGIARQLELMHELIEAKMSGPEFAHAWLAARRHALDEKERVRERFDRILTDVFYLLDDYVIDPSIRDSDDMTDEELVGRVRNALCDLLRLNS
ncbi:MULTISPECIES: colicin immunity domain-containing protein [unclassified Frankia]|uniref:colicin immunity domain-containing protein n=1 Tax=unclassified Frankia TaxID=2632575 RepID=UPI002AD42E1D|nr:MULTISPECIES: colicin immunity domain-containing protein [unclassified Frankia]